MRVLVTADAVGGVWTYALELAGGLARRGDAVRLVVLGPAPAAAQRQAAEATPGVSLALLGGALDWTAADEGELEAAARALAELAADDGTDLIHLSSPALAGCARFPAPVVGVAHSCLATWWEAMERSPPPPELAWRIDAVARGYARCDALIAPSAAFAAATARLYGVTPQVVHNGRALPPHPSTPDRATPVITAGRLWDRAKGAATLDAAASLDAPILALGPTRGPQGEGEPLAHLKLAGALAPAAVAAAMADAKVFVSAARYEPFGLAVLEAAQAGCALVLSDIATFRELWDGCALFVPADDPAAFAKAVAALLGDDGRRRSLAAAAQARAERYDLDRFVQATAAVHRSVLDARRKGEAA